MFAIFLLSMGCSPSLTFEVTRPAQISVDRSVKKVALVDRVSDDASKKLKTSFIAALRDVRNPKFLMIDNSIAQKAYTGISATVGQSLEKEQTENICKSTGATGVISIEKVGSNQNWTYDERTETETSYETVRQNGKEVEREVTKDVTVYTATLMMDGNANWMFYQCDGGVIDNKRQTLSQTWSGEGETRQDAKLDVESQSPMENTLFAQMGRRYMQRVSPFEASVTRDYYRTGHKGIKEGNKHLTAGEFQKARESYFSAVQATKGKKKGKALYNLAVVLERMGLLNKSLQRAKQANELLNSNRSEEYFNVLSKRKNEADKIHNQLNDDEQPSFKSRTNQ